MDVSGPCLGITRIRISDPLFFVRLRRHHHHQACHLHFGWKKQRDGDWRGRKTWGSICKRLLFYTRMNTTQPSIHPPPFRVCLLCLALKGGKSSPFSFHCVALLGIRCSLRPAADQKTGLSKKYDTTDNLTRCLLLWRKTVANRNHASRRKFVAKIESSSGSKNAI